jgi:methionine-rich copper-binding protein CopC
MSIKNPLGRTCLTLVFLLTATVRGAPWTPADLSNKALWLDASDLSASPVGAWNDKSGNNRNFSQTGANRPAYATNSFNTSYPGVTFDGTDDYMSAGDTLDVGTNSLGIVAAVKYNTTDTSGMVISKTRYAVGNGRYFMGRFQGTGFGLGTGAQYQYVGEGDFATAISPNADSSTSPRLLGFDLNRQTSGYIKNWINAVAVTTNTFTGNTTDYSSTDLLLLGAYGNSSGNGPQGSSYLSGVIAEVVVVQAAMSDSDRWKLEGYLAWKWGMVANLPADHPYKSAAPQSSDTTPPTIVTLSPTNNATGVAGYANLSATFNEGIQKGTGNITLKKTADNSTVESFDVATSSRITVSGATLTINPTNILAGLTGYYLQIDATAVKDMSGNSFAGIGDTTTWNFTTAVADATAPTIATLSPADNATGADVVANLVATFNESIQKGTGNITLKKSADNSTVETFDVATSPRVTVSGATLTIDPTSALLSSTGYYVEVASTAIQDLSENSFAGISGATAWNFTTEPLVLFDDFATNPNIAGKWTRYSYWGTESVTSTWNSTDQDLDLQQTGNSILGLYRTYTTRSATDTVTLTVKDFARTSGSWGYVALMISAGPQPSITDGANRYEFRILKGGSGFEYQVKANNGTDLIADTPTATFSGPVTLQIVRNAANYEFKANGSTLATGSTFTSAQHDAMVYYEIVFGGDGTTTATVDNFGIPPPPPPNGTLISFF